MVAGALNDDTAAGVSYRESLAGPTRCEEISAVRPVHAGVAEDDVLARHLFKIFAWPDGNGTAAHRLADVVIGLSLQIPRTLR